MTNPVKSGSSYIETMNTPTYSMYQKIKILKNSIWNPTKNLKNHIQVPKKREVIENKWRHTIRWVFKFGAVFLLVESVNLSTSFEKCFSQCDWSNGNVHKINSITTIHNFNINQLRDPLTSHISKIVHTEGRSLWIQKSVGQIWNYHVLNCSVRLSWMFLNFNQNMFQVPFMFHFN